MGNQNAKRIPDKPPEILDLKKWIEELKRLPPESRSYVMGVICGISGRAINQYDDAKKQ